MDNRFGEKRERQNLVSEFTRDSSVRPRPFNPQKDDGSSELQPPGSETDSVSLMETRGWQDNSSDLWGRERGTGISPERQPRILNPVWSKNSYEVQTKLQCCFSTASLVKSHRAMDSVGRGAVRTYGIKTESATWGLP
jgi:hypothetical protein